MSSSNDRRRVSREKSKEAQHERKAADKKEKAANAREKAQKKAASASQTSSASTSKQRMRAAVREDKKAVRYEKEAATESKKEAQASVRVGRAGNAARRSVETERKKDEAADKKRRREELAHARRVASERNAANQFTPIAPTPNKQRIRLALLVASPSGEERIRVDQEAREIRETLKRASLGSRVDVEVWPAATFEDVVHALNDDKPDIVHFSGHGSLQGLTFDGTDSVDPNGHEFSYGYVGRALAATDWPPRLVVLNACFSFSGVDEILSASPAVIAMTESITDIGAKAFGAKFYAGIGSGQSLQSSYNQAKLALDTVTDEGDKAELVVLDGIDASSYRLVEPEEQA